MDAEAEKFAEDLFKGFQKTQKQPPELNARQAADLMLLKPLKQQFMDTRKHVQHVILQTSIVTFKLYLDL